MYTLMIDGIWWLVILLTVVAVLWLLAHLRGTKNDSKNNPVTLSSTKSPTNNGLQKIATLLKQKFPDYRVSCRANHLLISKQGKKIAMITVDKTLVAGQRRLGEVPIINYHRIPNRAQLNANLQDTE